MEDTYDVIIVGGGVTGCACAFELTSYGYSCLLLEKNEHLVSEASSGNSGMLHTGFDALDDSIELDCIRRCQSRIFPLAENLGVPVKKIGATMVAWNDQQMQVFPRIIEKSNTAGCSAIQQLSVSELRENEPRLAANARGALYIADESVTDPWLLPILLANDARKKGAVVLTDTRVMSVARDNKWHVETTRGSFRSKCVVNCAGLYGDVLDKLAGKTNFRIHPRKGQYTMYSRSARGLINSSIVPVPTDVGKGVIVFRSVYDNVVVGPTAENVQRRERAEIDESIVHRLAAVARTTIPDLTSHPVVSLYTGVRPATETKDYILKIDVEKHWITVGGIRSTGLSGCLGIAERVKDMVENGLNISPSKTVVPHVAKPDVTFTRYGTVIIDGLEQTITHPLTIIGKREMNGARL